MTEPTPVDDLVERLLKVGQSLPFSSARATVGKAATRIEVLEKQRAEDKEALQTALEVTRALVEETEARALTAERSLEAFKWAEGLYAGEQLTLEHIAAELADFRMLCHEVPLVYDHITRGQVSKATTSASVVIAIADDCTTDDVEEAVKEALEEITKERDGLRAALRSILFLRPGGPCRNKLVEQIENLARAALQGGQDDG